MQTFDTTDFDHAYFCVHFSKEKYANYKLPFIHNKKDKNYYFRTQDDRLNVANKVLCLSLIHI